MNYLRMLGRHWEGALEENRPRPWDKGLSALLGWGPLWGETGGGITTSAKRVGVGKEAVGMGTSF